MERYNPKTLVKDLVDRLSIIIPDIKQYQSDNIIVRVDPPNGTISFDKVIVKDPWGRLYSGQVPSMIIEDTLKKLNRAWANKVFLGTNGYYMFGDILSQGKIY